VSGGYSTCRQWSYVGALLAVTLLTACTASGDTGIRPPFLNSTIPRPAVGRVNRTQSIVVLCARTETATTLPMLVPDVVGLPIQDAANALLCHGFRLAIKPPTGSTSGVVLAQVPHAGNPSPANRTITISVPKP
jgi:hypothetical protein